MKTRMQPIGNIWSKFPRTVRDVATMCGKQVRIEMEGKETELDKTIVEAIKDPLTHIVRNSVDHGIEKPEKPRRGRQARRRPSASARVSRRRAGHHRNFRRRRRPRRRQDSPQSRRKRFDHAGTGRAHGRARRRQSDLPPRILHRGKSHQCLGPRRRHGRRQNQHRKNRRHRRCAIETWHRHYRAHEDPAHARDHSRADRHQRRRPLRHPANQFARTGSSRRRRRAKGHRAHPRSSRAPLAWPSSPARLSQSRTQGRRRSARSLETSRRQYRRAPGRRAPVRPRR